LAICGSQAGVLRNATTMAWSGPSRPFSHYRASARPYTPQCEVMGDHPRKCPPDLGFLVC
jgi:hypothetical protein